MIATPSAQELELRVRSAREPRADTRELVDALNDLAWAVRQKEPQRSLALAQEANARAREPIARRSRR